MLQNLSDFVKNNLILNYMKFGSYLVLDQDCQSILSEIRHLNTGIYGETMVSLIYST
jgi:hypothetical protein